MAEPLLTIDVAHPPRHPEEVEAELLHVWGSLRGPGAHRAVKIIHGYGSSGAGGATRETVRNWLYRRRKELRATVNGEQYGLFSPTVQEMRRELGSYTDADLDAANPGITVVWVR